MVRAHPFMSEANAPESLSNDTTSSTMDPRDAERRVFLALGSNVGDRLGHLRFAVDQLERRRRISVIEASPVYESPAHTLDESAEDDPAAERAYLNAVVEVRTGMDADELLAEMLEIERLRGRDRSTGKRWAPRTLDVDLLIFGSKRIDEPQLHVPHPRMPDRRFVLKPLADLAPDLHVPAPFDAPVKTLLSRCPDEDRLRRQAASLREPSDRSMPS